MFISSADLYPHFCMRLNTIKIRNFRKLNDVEVKLGEATFLIGANNSGKSSTLDAIEYLVADKKLDASCRSKYIDDKGNEVICSGDVIRSVKGQ